MEQWDLLDGQGRPTGETMMRGERLRAGQYHLVVHIWILDGAGRVLLQWRASHLKLMPGMWAVTGGSAVAGEDSPAAARRELREELGIDAGPDGLEFMGRLRRRNSICDLWLLRREVDASSLQLQKEEVADARWMTWEEMMKMVEDKSFHHYGKEYFDAVYAYLYGESKTK